MKVFLIFYIACVVITGRYMDVILKIKVTRYRFARRWNTRFLPHLDLQHSIIQEGATGLTTHILSGSSGDLYTLVENLTFMSIA